MNLLLLRAICKMGLQAVRLVFIGCTVDVIYDPQDITELTIEYQGHPLGK